MTFVTKKVSRKQGRPLVGKVAMTAGGVVPSNGGACTSPAGPASGLRRWNSSTGSTANLGSRLMFARRLIPPSVRSSLAVRTTGSRSRGPVFAGSIRHMAGRLAAGSPRHAMRRSTGRSSLHLFQPERTRNGGIPSSWPRARSAICQGACISAGAPIPRHFPQPSSFGGARELDKCRAEKGQGREVSV